MTRLRRVANPCTGAKQVVACRVEHRQLDAVPRRDLIVVENWFEELRRLVPTD